MPLGTPAAQFLYSASAADRTRPPAGQTRRVRRDIYYTRTTLRRLLVAAMPLFSGAIIVLQNWREHRYRTGTVAAESERLLQNRRDVSAKPKIHFCRIEEAASESEKLQRNRRS